MKKHNIGFTLVELMVVITIIAILTAVAIPSYQYYIIKSQQTDAVMSINIWRVKQEMYFSQNLEYAQTFEDLGESITKYKNSLNGFYSIIFESDNVGNIYIIAIPKKPNKLDHCGWYRYDLVYDKRTNDPTAVTPNRSANESTEAECWLLTK